MSLPLLSARSSVIFRPVAAPLDRAIRTRGLLYGEAKKDEDSARGNRPPIFRLAQVVEAFEGHDAGGTRPACDHERVVLAAT
jgi:hypothetical protein